MEKPLRVLVQIDTRNAAASIEVRGALTGPSCGTLLNILRHTATLGANITINLTRAARIDAAAVAVLTEVAGDVERSAPADPPLRVRIQLPETPASQPPADQLPLDNDEALELVLRRDSRVLAGPHVVPDAGWSSETLPDRPVLPAGNP
ncbi:MULTISPECIES: hypothetical protein [unclassified Arthrobacter]|uniref:hypothetical protein n=1 Tax=unclassified Arthrobacter TaxID=235627 RepID=UPI001E4607A5|nr:MULTISPECIES: hypothetical protein [unclassified Arthrobacter]MCC9144132.1 hypothetical protein [Arthrobacter sp. zg-Y919]MDK1275357.1 hypothetical protein [Arthrobacter sp. zg.Y919]MDM7990989.1 hypothetical protein [Arthrobacter sp. zg-Y877]WIB03255.1 hypothetical protein QNO10_00690 [Arthrobacter sp. zg-Y919]